MGKPAARISDHHTCPKKTGKVPHVGGPVAAGSPNVFIGGLPAARVGDMMVCVGPPDSIAKGSASVFINGKPAARMGDKTSHGGVIVGGCGTVTIGDAGIVVPTAVTSSRGASNKKKSENSSEKQPAPLVVAQQVAALQSAAKKAQGTCQVCEEADSDA